MLQSIHVANCRLVEHILKRTTVVQTTAHFGHELVGDIYSEAAALDPAVKNMAKVLFALETSFAVLADTPGTAKAQRSQSGWPKAGNLLLKPIRDIYRKFFSGWHDVYVTYNHMYSQVNSLNCFQCSNL
jgi:hypothetical protein